MNVLKHKFPEEIFGEFITLRKITLNDAEFIFGLRIQKAAQYLNRPEGYSVKSQIKWQKSRTEDEVNYIIYDGSFRVGMVSIYDCDWTNGVSNVGRLLLDGQFIHNHKPYGLEALKMTYNYVFNEMGFRKIAGTINSNNEKVVRLQQYLGMHTEGFFYSHVLLRGEPQNLVFMTLFKEDFLSYEVKINSLLEKYRNIKLGAFQG